MHKIFIASAVLCSLLLGISMQTSNAQSPTPKIEATYGLGTKNFKLATGSPGELGLLQVLGECEIRYWGWIYCDCLNY
jgi:tungstate transport system substrate-binding protein